MKEIWKDESMEERGGGKELNDLTSNKHDLIWYNVRSLHIKIFIRRLLGYNRMLSIK